MKTRQYGLTSLALAAAVSVSAVLLSTGAVAQDKIQDQTKSRTQDMIYGSQLMTPAERSQYMNQMRTLKTAQEREAFRLQHHEQMLERARAKGVTLPDAPQAAGMGPARGMGGGGGAGGAGAGGAGGKGGGKN